MLGPMRSVSEFVVSSHLLQFFPLSAVVLLLDDILFLVVVVAAVIKRQKRHCVPNSKHFSHSRFSSILCWIDCKYSVYYTHGQVVRLNFERKKKCFWCKCCAHTWQWRSMWVEMRKNNKHTRTHTLNRFETMAFCDRNSLGNSKFTHDIHMVDVVVVVVMTHTIDTLSVCVLCICPAQKEKNIQKVNGNVCLVRCCCRVQSEFDCDMEFIFAYSVEIKYDRMKKEAEHTAEEKKTKRTIPERNIFRYYSFISWMSKRERDRDTETEEM